MGHMNVPIPEHLFVCIDHVGVAVPDLDAAMAFYADVLGMQVQHQETNQEQIGLMYRAVPLGDPDYYNLRMAVEVLSGGMAARPRTRCSVQRAWFAKDMSMTTAGCPSAADRFTGISSVSILSESSETLGGIESASLPISRPAST